MAHGLTRPDFARPREVPADRRGVPAFLALLALAGAYLAGTVFRPR